MSAAGPGPFVQPADTAIAPAVNQRGTVLSLGLLLVAVNVLTTEAGLQFVGNLTGLPVDSLTRYTQSGSWVPVRDIALQVLLVLLLAGFAGTGEGAGSLALALVAGLWIVWALNHTGLWSGFLGSTGAASLFSAGSAAGAAANTSGRPPTQTF